MDIWKLLPMLFRLAQLAMELVLEVKIQILLSIAIIS